MVHCLETGGLEDVRAYHGKLSLTEKKTLDASFRNKQFQVLVATETYEVGTHTPHVKNVLRVGCMRNLVGVLVQEFGRAGRSGELSDGFLLFNEFKDDKQCKI